jgi:hypothetical protein
MGSGAEHLASIARLEVRTKFASCTRLALHAPHCRGVCMQEENKALSLRLQLLTASVSVREEQVR